MPIISIKIAKGRSIEQKRKLVKAVTDSVVSTLDVKPEWVSVLIEEFERENWSTGGELHIDKFGSGFGHSGTK
ncbi:4-oxalocrotonate tautomerase family protein [Desulfohalobiaceae bacterium Ax17]|uniref:tautomerase family protein n=1 Tax=Desulfovulcanus ferrireducens TaxID=2831190 RepID=UPI00207BC6A0|nr:4-oxalocrotonate tautomerase family protein [Desulfovulcanus ferrireducens]